MSTGRIHVRVVIGGRTGHLVLLGEEGRRRLPGGEPGTGETIGEAARRLAREQTGLEVLLSDLVGIYETSADDGTPAVHFVFRAAEVGGRAAPGPGIRQLLRLTTAALRALPREDLAQPDLLIPVIEDLDRGTAWPLAILA